MPVLSLACHLRHNTPNIPSRYNNEQTTKQTKAINNSYIYINISCKCDTNRAGHFTLDAYASRPVACFHLFCNFIPINTLSAGDKVNSLWPSDTIWRHKSVSTLAQVMVCCLTAPSHCLKQCWLIISNVQWHSSECNFTRDISATSH